MEKLSSIKISAEQTKNKQENLDKKNQKSVQKENGKKLLTTGLVGLGVIGIASVMLLKGKIKPVQEATDKILKKDLGENTTKLNEEIAQKFCNKVSNTVSETHKKTPKQIIEEIKKLENKRFTNEEADDQITKLSHTLDEIILGDEEKRKVIDEIFKTLLPRAGSIFSASPSTPTTGKTSSEPYLLKLSPFAFADTWVKALLS